MKLFFPHRIQWAGRLHQLPNQFDLQLSLQISVFPHLNEL